MVTLYVASNESYSGKTLTCVVLGTRWRGQGRKVGYLKPIGMPTPEGGPDGRRGLRRRASSAYPPRPRSSSPGVLSPEFCAQGAEAARQQVQSAFAAASQGKDVMLVNGSGSVLTRGAHGRACTGPEVAEAARRPRAAGGASAPPSPTWTPSWWRSGRSGSDCSATSSPASRRSSTRSWPHRSRPVWSGEGVTVLGVLPDDPVLHSVSVRRDRERDRRQPSSPCPEAAEELMENFVIGAMTVESALRYFRQTPRKCVITGGDRGDIQLAALETPTKCLVLTGDLRPSEVVLNRARELSVPVLLVKQDTLSTVATIESHARATCGCGSRRRRGTRRSSSTSTCNSPRWRRRWDWDEAASDRGLAVGVISLGCPKNLVDTEVMLGLLRQAGFALVGDPSQADILIVNTCCFIEDARTEAAEAIEEALAWRRTRRAKALLVAAAQVVQRGSYDAGAGALRIER